MRDDQSRCERDGYIIPSRQVVQLLPDDKSLKIRHYHRSCAPRKAPKGWTKWDTMNNSMSSMFRLGR